MGPSRGLLRDYEPSDGTFSSTRPPGAVVPSPPSRMRQGVGLLPVAGEGDARFLDSVFIAPVSSSTCDGPSLGMAKSSDWQLRHGTVPRPVHVQ